jgi:hypothetical protein
MKRTSPSSGSRTARQQVALVASLALLLVLAWFFATQPRPEPATLATADESSIVERPARGVVEMTPRSAEPRGAVSSRVQRPARADSSRDGREAGAIDNELVVRLRPGSSIEALADALNARVAGGLPILGAYRLVFADAISADHARSLLEGHPAVDELESNFGLGLPLVQEMIGFGGTGGLSIRPGDAGGQLIIGLIDSRVEAAGQAWEGFLLPGLSLTEPVAGSAEGPTHGTSMVTAMLNGLATGANGAATSNVRILPVDVFGNGSATTSFDVATGILVAIDGGATIINLSLASEGRSPLLAEVIAAGRRAGIVFFGAAGNDPNAGPTYPAAIPAVVAVTALDGAGNVAGYANRGDFVDIAAPGSVVLSHDGGRYRSSGTSVSTAFASGWVAGFAEVNSQSQEAAEEAAREQLALRPGG